MIRAEALSKTFGSGATAVDAVQDLDLDVRQGEVFGFLGPNGAGKTTTVRLLSTLVRPTAGRAWIDGLAVGEADSEIRARVGLLTEAPGHYERLTVRQNLEVYARLYAVVERDRQIENYLGLLGLWDARDAPAGTLSKGMKQKLALARALVHEPPVLFLDEPTSALDPEAAKTVRDFIADLRGRGRTVFLCTHNLDEAERLCDRIAVFQRRLIAVDAPEALRRGVFGRQTVVRLAERDAAYIPAVAALGFVEKVDERQGPDGSVELLVTLQDPDLQNPDVVRALVEAGAAVRSVTEVRHSLEDVYMSLISNSGR